MVFWEGYISDELLGRSAPIVVYWIYAGMYQLLPTLDHHGLHPRKGEVEEFGFIVISDEGCSSLVTAIGHRCASAVRSISPSFEAMCRILFMD